MQEFSKFTGFCLNGLRCCLVLTGPIPSSLPALSFYVLVSVLRVIVSLRRLFQCAYSIDITLNILLIWSCPFSWHRFSCFQWYFGHHKNTCVCLAWLREWLIRPFTPLFLFFWLNGMKKIIFYEGEFYYMIHFNAESLRKSTRKTN